MSKLTSQCVQHRFADSNEVCSGIGIIGLVLSQVFAQERQDNIPQDLIHVRLTDQVSLYTIRSVVLGFKHLPRDMANVKVFVLDF